MNLTYLKYFLELAKIQHYGRAAELLGISQPGLSHAIAALEKELGMPLFKKDGRNIALNRFGKNADAGSGKDPFYDGKL